MILASEMLQQLDFSQGSLRQNLLGKHIGDFFDCNTLAGGCIIGSTNRRSFVLALFILVQRETFQLQMQKIAPHVLTRRYRKLPVRVPC